MVSSVKSKGRPTEYFGLSDDTKPSEGVGNADKFTEIDTGVKHLFDAENGQWYQVEPIPSADD